VRTAEGDVNGDGTPDTIAITGPGIPLRVTVINGLNGTTMVAPFDPFGGDFTGGGFVTTADFEGNGHFDFVVTADQGGGPRVSIFSVVNGQPVLKANFVTLDPDFRGGARAAAGDINGDGVPDLAISAGYAGGPRVEVLDGRKLFTTDGLNPADKLIGDFFAFDQGLRNGAYVSIGDVNGDGLGDLILGAGPGGGPEVRVLSGKTLLTAGSAVALASPLADFFVAGNMSDRDGVRVAAKDLDGDGKADVITGTGNGQSSLVRVYYGSSIGGVGEPTGFQDLDPFAGITLTDGIYVG
jgi:hypothetical protein